MSLHPGQWECWDPWPGSNVVRLPVHLPPPMPPDTPTPPWCPLHPCQWECLDLDWAQCGWAPSPPATPRLPDTPCWPPDTLWCPYTSAGPWHPLLPEQKSRCQKWYYCRWAWHVISLLLRLLFCHMYPYPPSCPLNAPGRGIWWPRVVLT